MKKSMRFGSSLLMLALAACGGGEQGQAPAEEAQEPAAQPEAAAEQAPAAEMTMELPEGVTPEMVARGQEVFNKDGICYTCHLEGGVGGPLAPDLTDSEWINIDGSYEAIVETVTNGVPQPKQHPGLMLPKGGSTISDEDVKAVAAYVWTLSHGG